MECCAVLAYDRLMSRNSTLVSDHYSKGDNMTYIYDNIDICFHTKNN